MITQAIKGWLQKVFAWWPWKPAPARDYPRVVSAVSRDTLPEMPVWTSQDQTVPQAGATPYRLTLESRSEHLSQPFSEALDMPPLSPLVPLSASTPEPNADPTDSLHDAPTSQQRLEFLRYLVQHGIVNEGFEKRDAE